MKLKTYIINLEKSTVRKEHMQSLLSQYGFMDVEFVKAIDGRKLSDEDRERLFDYKRAVDIYGRRLNQGEVGCVLSHRKTYRQMLDSGARYALVLEDDVAIVRDLNELDLESVDKLLASDTPRVLMLSGDYWYFKQKPIVRLFSAVGAYGYILNAAAARLILNLDRPCNVADDWAFYKRLGLKMYAVYPYMLDANVNMEVLPSDVKQDSWGIDRSKMSTGEVVSELWVGTIKKFLKMIDHFEYKTNIFQNKIAPKKTNPFK